MDKAISIKKYDTLVNNRKSCTICASEMENPSCYPDLDSNQLGPLTLWQNSLEAEILVVAQDWGSIKYFKDYNGKDNPNEITSLNLEEFLKSIDLDPGGVLEGKSNKKLFFTNVVLCLKCGTKSKSLTAKVINACRDNFLKETIDILPNLKYIVTLGAVARNAVNKVYGGKALGSMKSTISEFNIEFGTVKLFPMFHPGSLGLRNRNKETQLGDWQRLKKYLK